MPTLTGPAAVRSHIHLVHPQLWEYERTEVAVYQTYVCEEDAKKPQGSDHRSNITIEAKVLREVVKNSVAHGFSAAYWPDRLSAPAAFESFLLLYRRRRK